MKANTWYRTWFDTPYYHLLYKHRDGTEAASFLDTLLKYLGLKPGAHILDMACGRGRHSIYMASKGYSVTGIDLSESNMKAASEHAHDHLQFVVHDMRLPFRESEYSAVMNLFTSFGYFDRDTDNYAVLETAHRALKPKGVFVIDFLNVELVKQNLVPHEVITAEGVQFEVSRSLSDGQITKHIRITDQGELFQFEERVKAFYRQDFMGMLAKCHFEVLDVFGDYHLGAFDEATSPRLIFIVRKLV